MATAATTATTASPQARHSLGQSRYGGIASALRERILSGEWAPAAAIPAESALAQDYGVALGTVRQAIALLVEDGMLERKQGKGTFVSAGLAGASMLRFFQFRSRDATGEPPTSRIVSRRARPADDAERAAFALGARAQVLQLERVRSIAGEPCLAETIVLPLPLFGALVDSDPEDWGDLLYPLYMERCGVVIHRAEDIVSFAQLGAAQARRLRLEAGHPCAVVRRRAFDRAGHCVELRTSRGDAFAFEYTAHVR